MKLYRNAIILLVIVALLVGAYFLVKNRKSDDDDSITQSKTYDKLTDYTIDQVESVTLENDEGRFVIVKKDDDWALETPTDLKYDPSALSSIVINASSIVTDKMIEENAADLSIYGLDDPAVARIKGKDGVTVSIEIGNKTPTGGGYYVKLEGTNKVYVIGSYTGDKLTTGRNGMRTKQLFEAASDKFLTLAMNRRGENVFASVKDEDGNTWSMTTPIKGSVNESAFYPMLEALANATILEFIEDKPADLAKYGLDKPVYEFVFSAEGMDEVKLQMGIEKSKDTSIYAKLDGNDEVFTVDITAFTFLDKPLKEIVNVFAYIVNIDQVKKIDLTMDGKTTNMTVDVYKDEEGNPDTDKDKFYVNGIDASGKDENDDQPFRKFYQALVGVTIDDIDINGKPSGNADITIEYTLKDGSMKVEYIPKDENFYYVVRNDEYTGILVKQRNKVDFGIDGLKQAYKTMMDFLAQ
jgi:hypothetical protein